VPTGPQTSSHGIFDASKITAVGWGDCIDARTNGQAEVAPTEIPDDLRSARFRCA